MMHVWLNRPAGMGFCCYGAFGACACRCDIYIYIYIYINVESGYKLAI
jgi:hypothetical protein